MSDMASDVEDNDKTTFRHSAVTADYLKRFMDLFGCSKSKAIVRLVNTAGYIAFGEGPLPGYVPLDAEDQVKDAYRWLLLNWVGKG